MMNCRTARKWLSPYLDSQLETAVTFEVSEHLRVCIPCSRRFEAERRVDRLMRTVLTRPTMPDALWRRIQADISVPRRRPLRWNVAWAAAALAACVLLAVSLVSVFRAGDGASSVDSGVGRMPAIVAALDALAPDNKPFEPAGPPWASDLMEFDAFGVRLAMAGGLEMDAVHNMQLIDYTLRRDAQDRDYLEVRLNCCGNPVLMIVAREGDSDAMPEMIEGASFAAGSASMAFNDVNVATRRVDGLVLVAASRHPVTQVVGAWKAVKT